MRCWPGDETWWQVKFIRLDGGNQPITFLRNVISSPNVPG